MPRKKNTRPARRTRPQQITESDLKLILKRDLYPALDKLTIGVKEIAGERNWITMAEYESLLKDVSGLISLLGILTHKDVSKERKEDSQLARSVLNQLNALKKQTVLIYSASSTSVLHRGRNTVQLDWIKKVIHNIKRNVDIS